MPQGAASAAQYAARPRVAIPGTTLAPIAPRVRARQVGGGTTTVKTYSYALRWQSSWEDSSSFQPSCATVPRRVPRARAPQPLLPHPPRVSLVSAGNHQRPTDAAARTSP